MPTIYVRRGESLDSALNRFTETCNRAKIRKEIQNKSEFASKKQRQREKFREKQKRRGYTRRIKIR